MTGRNRLVFRIVAVAGALVAAVYFAAIWDMRRERQKRLYLGDRLYTDVRGSGDPVVFLSGLQGSTRYWGHQFDTLAASHRLVFADELGFGRSPWPEGIGYTLDDQLGSLRRTLVAIGATKNVTIVAHSFGTVLASYYAARYRGEVRRVVLLGTPVFDSEEQGRERIRQMSWLAGAFAFNRPIALAACTMNCAFRPVLRRVLPLVASNRPAEVVSDSVLHDLSSVDGAVTILLRHPIRQPIAMLGSRVVLIHGRSDAVTPLDVVESMARRTSAHFLPVDSDHHHYLTNAGDLIIGEITRAEP